MRNPAHILITGASSGIGAALAVAYAQPGVTLSLHGRNQSRLTWVKAQTHAKGAVVETMAGNVTDRAAMAAWIKARDDAKPLDLVIANAGISPGVKTGAETADDAYQVFDTNLTGVLNTVQPAIDALKPRRRGQIALISSLASFRGFSGGASYCASKAAVRIYGEALRADLAADGIRVNVICPGFIDTPMTAHNPFPMPMKMTADRAARIIIEGLAYDRARIAFPGPVYMLVRLAAALPQDVINRLADRLRKNTR